MGNPTPPENGIIPAQINHSHKRAYSYATTISHLFATINDTKQPADRVIGQYFRDHKKHGSKDRRIIRETLFGLFRWWGWLAQLSAADIIGKDQPLTPQWFRQLSGCALLEQHGWQDIIDAWHELGELPQWPALDGVEIQQKSQQLQQHFPELNFSLDLLLPSWFWQVTTPRADQQLALIAAMSSRPPIWARAQGLPVSAIVTELQALDIDAKPSPYFSDALSLGHKSINFNQVSLYQNGKIEIQDLASQVIGQICAPSPNDTWWDACSGAGGKSLQLRALMQAQGHGRGHIVASDIRQHALDELLKRAKRAGYTQITLARWRSEALPVEAQAFDGVLVDAPCSCTGTWRRNPDMRWLDATDVVEQKPALQLDILSRSSHAVKPGGVLVYATCSLANAENEQVVNAFLAAHPEFSPETIIHPFTGESTTMLTVWPYEADSDGMFVCRMRRQ
ncbi:RsmB/NOP family class I SAM-dependent RNA methyltransferase [Shewanella sp. NIFS-20-20]|uniref:RsmB/NOP family class I SAM-dependent RNA methyltransferase n=1 Tax=Shewanella sp. NIFS-20-20 TaxID=2853806 RepID=UPI001C48006F|nr:RsmB/NOP family class I SAM-dependent RNA methyltransferase [Shewanella sp. NIFS-20-20]MBV7317336.1 RsmB/NOP family class I SAM-dependent RNA methyltransferase [Shewanella sp. NIFS-20-20]